MTTATFGDKAKVWGVALRAFAFPASIVPVVVGSAYAWYATKQFSWIIFILALVAGMLYHTACNLINDYYDYKHGLDHEGAFGGSGVLVSKALTPMEVIIGAYVCAFLGSVIGLYFVYLYGIPMLVLGLIGLLGVVFYTTTPLSAKYAALGSPLVFLEMGVLMVVGGYLVQTGGWSWNVVWISLPVAFIVAAILQANDIRDVVHDRNAKIRTNVTLFGPTAGRAYLAFLLFAPYLTVIALALLGIAPWGILLPVITLPLAIAANKLHWDVRDEISEKLKDTPEMVAKLHLAFGLLMTIGIISGYWFPR